MQNINKTLLSLGAAFRTITLFLALFFFNHSVSLAQCDPGSASCADSDVIDFPFSTRMLSDINGNGEIPGCNGQGFFHNTTWYRIIPTTPFIFIDITSSNCTTVGGNQGIQLGLYPECDPNSQPIGTIQCDCASPGQTITLGGVVNPNTPYFIMVDGCSGSTCDLSMVLTTGAVQMPVVNLGNPSQPETNDQIPTCPGAELTFTVPPVNDADIYTWNFPPGTIILEQNCNEVTVEWGPIGGNVNVNVTNVTNGQTNVGPPLNVPIDPPMYSLTRDYCSPESTGYTFYGDGVTYSEGVYPILVPGPVCDTLVTLTVVENLIAIANLIEIPTSCNSSQDNYFENGQASIFMQNTGGGPYSYVWENSAVTGPTNNQLPVGTTGVTITDLSTGCELEEFIFIDEPPYLSAQVNVDVPPSCGSAADGEMIVFTMGGTSQTGNYTYLWDDGSMIADRTDITAGVHELTITDDNGCEFVWIGNIVASGGNVTATESNLTGESCAGANNGSVTLTGDGPGNFTFTWPGNIEAATRNDLAAGTYEVTITNDSGCSGTQDVTIAAGSSFTVDASNISDVGCFGDNDGSITVDVTGGTAPLSYTVGSGTVAGNVISDLTAGNYTLVVTDGAGCTSGDIPVVVGTPTEFLPTIANTPVTCGGNGDGTATVTPVGGTGPYTYLWGDGETTQGITNLSGGTFTVVVTDANMCSVPLSTDVDGGGSLGVLVDPAVTQLEVSCPGETDGTVTVTVTGATGNVTYVWTGSSSTTATASGLGPGMYSVVAQDGAGCSSAPFPVTITAPSPLMVTEVGTTQTSCEGGTDGTAEVSVSGGTGTNYTFAWDNGETTNPAVGLGPGPHTVTVRDENMCPQTLSVTIAEPAAITATIDPVDPECFGDTNGSITVNAMGGSGTYTYDIGNGPQASNEFLLLGPNTYTITVANMDGSCSETFTETLMGQSEIIATVTPTPVSCAGAGDGQATVTPSGGVGPYTYLWTDGETTQTIMGKSGGGQFVTVTDANMCTEIFSTSIAESTPIVVTLDNQTGAACDGSGGATASVNVNGGSGNYTYTWSAGTSNGNGGVSDLNAGMVTVVVQDDANCSSMPFEITILAPDPVTLMEDQVTAETCFEVEDGTVTVMTNGGNGPFEFSIDNNATQQASNEFTNLAPGDYIVNVTDDNGCTDFVNITIPAAAQIIGSVDAMSDLIVCDGDTDGSITITASGGDGNLMYQLNNGTPQASNVFNNLGGGSFIITVIDGNSCTSEDIMVDVDELAEITLDVNLASSDLTICDSAGDGMVSINASGGDNNFQYNLVGVAQQASNEFSNLSGGDYTVEVTDGNGCTNDIDFTVTELMPIVIDLDAMTSDLIVCSGASDGTVTFTASGGDNNLTYDIGSGAQNDGEFNGLIPNNYTLTVMDGNMCSETFDFTVDTAPAITVQVDAAASDLDICDGDTDGSVTIDASGGDGNFMYTLGGVTQGSPIFNNLNANIYTGMVEDGNGCTEPITVTVTSSPAITANISASDLNVCNGFSDGSVTITASGGDNNFSYNIDNNGDQPSNVFNNLAPGPHTVMITDGSGCTTTPVDFTVIEGAAISASVDAASELLVCDGLTDGSITIMASGGTGGLMYDIGNGPQASNEFTNLGEGNYTILITDADGCSPMPVDVTIDAATPVVGMIDPVSNLSICNGETIGSITINGSGGDGNLMYTLNPGGLTQASNVFNNLSAGNYSIDIVDGNNCTTTPIDFTVQEAAAITANITSSDLTVCNGFTDGSVTITASGGDDNFTYEIDGNDQTSNVFNNLAPGPHTVLITDGNGCTTTPIDFTVIEGTAISASVDAASDLLVCDGLTDGSITIMAAGGTGGLMYDIGNGPQASNEFSNLGEGNYTILITDSDGCSPMPVDVTIDAATPVVGMIDPVSNLSICNGETIGSVTINGSGGDGNLTYTLNPGNISQTSNVFSDLPAGPYTIDIVDGNSCTTAPIDFVVQEAPALTVAVDPNSDLINCFGEADGSVTINASGGNGGFMYDIGNGPQASNTFNDLAPGDYTIMVTDVNNCPSAPVDITVVEATVLDGGLTLASSDLTVCSGVADGTAAIEATGGDGNYTYVLDNNPGQASNIFNDLGEGNYTVTIIDGNGCEHPVPFTVAPAPAITYTTAITNVGCFGQAEGEIAVNVIAGDGPFDFIWSNAQVTETAQLLTAGLHTVTITDVNMCEVVETFTITEPAAALNIDNANAVIQPATCGDTNGSVAITVSGGTSPYSYQWSDNGMSTDPDLINVGPGSYTVTITDANMCEVISESFSVSEPGALEVTPSSVPVACNGDNSGSISLDVQGGTGPYTFVWSDDPMETTANRIDLLEGTYTVVVSDSDGCELPAINISISEPPALTTTLTPTQASCGLSDGSVSLLVEGGTGVGTYTYAWSNGTSDPNLNDVPAGIYDVTVTDMNMCPVISMTAEVTNPGTPELTISGTDVTCFGESTGSIMLGITGGSGGNTIDWGPNNPGLNGLTNPTNLPAGTYNVTVTDMSMCESTETITITEPTSAVFIDDVNAIIQPATCGDTNGSVSVNVIGGTPPYTYQWSDGITTDPDLINVGPGNYTLTVTDANMCSTISGNMNVSEPGALTVNPTSVPATCNGDDSGSISLDVQGGTGPYTFVWSDIADDVSTRNLLPQGTYTVVVSDASGCELPALNIEVSEPDALTAVNTPVMANCGQSNGAINVTVSGGTEPYSFAWSDGVTTTEDLSNVPAGSYTLTVTDFNMCEFIMPTAEIENPNPPVIGITSTNVTCNNTATGTATVSVTGGSGIYTYTWSDPAFNGQDNPTTLPVGTFTVTVSDNLNCSAEETITITEPEPLVLNIEQVIEATCGEANGSVAIGITGGTTPYTYAWSNGASTEDIQNLTPGTYFLDFADGNGCILTESFVVSEPNALTVSALSINQVDCSGGNNGSIQVNAEGGSGPGTYTFMWSNGDTDETIDNLPAGTYGLTVTDLNNCSFEYTETITEPEPIMITGTTTDAVCGQSNGSINLTVTGGTGTNYTYVWDNGAAAVEDPGNLPAGQYNVTVTDENSCEAEPFTIAVTSPNAPVVEFASAPVTCNGANDGSIDLTVTGGNGDVTITWNDPTYNGQTSVDNLPPGVYQITAEDQDGCTFPVNITIDEPLLLEAFVVDPQSSTLCNGSSDGSIELTVQGGTAQNGTYSYQWTNGAANVQNPDNLAAGTYSVIVTDDNGCTAEETVTITEPDAIALTADPISASCSNTADGGIEVSVIGGTGDYTYEWNGGAFDTEDLTDIQPGNYTLVVSDQNSCNGTIDVVVPAPAPVVISLAEVSDYNGFNTSCNESEDGFITVSAEGGNSGYSYAWADGTDGPTISEIGQGNYSVIVTDQEGCTGENNFSLDAPAPITVDVETDEPECFGENNGVVIINGVEGGRLPYRFSLNNGDYTTAQFFGNLGSGTYSLAVEDANGCTNDLDVVVDETEQITVSLSDEPVIEINLGDSITLSPQPSIALDSNFVWSVSAIAEDTLGQELRPVVRPFNTTSYSFTVTDEFGCTASDEVLVQVNKPRSIYIPNAFNPNSVNGNNLFTIHGGQDVSIVRSVKIFNRWGELVFSDQNFSTDNPLRGSWNGFFRSKEAQSGVYVYIFEVDFIDGYTETYSGDITLLR